MSTNKNTTLKFWQKGYFYALLMATIVVILFSGFIFSGKTIVSSDQSTSFGARVFFKTSILKYHQFPLWNSSILSGMPTIDALFGDVMYLPVLPIKLIMPVWKSFVYKMIFHIILAGILFYLMLRRGFSTSAFTAFVGGVLYMLNTEFFSHIYPGHDAKMYVIALLPFVVWRLKVLTENPNLLNASLLAFSVGLSILTGHVQLAYFVLWGLFFYWLFYTVIKRNSGDLNNSKIVTLGLFFWGSVFFGVALAAVQIYPSFMFVKNEFSVRGVHRGFEFASSWSLHWPEIFALWVPEFCSTNAGQAHPLHNLYWSENPFKLNYEYVGAVAMLLATLSIVRKPKNAWRLFWLGVAIFALLFSLGAHTPVFYIAYHIVPGVKKFRACSMIMMWFSFAVVLLASLSLKDLELGDFLKFDNEKKKKWLNGISIALVGVTVISLLFSIKGFVIATMNILAPQILAQPDKYKLFDMNFSKAFVPFLWLWWFWATLLLLMLYFHIKGTVSAKTLIWAILIIGVIDLVRVDSLFIQPISPRRFFYKDRVLENLAKELPKNPFRVFSLPGIFNEQNGAGIFHLEEIGGFHDNEMKWYRKFRQSGNGNNYLKGLLKRGANGRPYLDAKEISHGNNYLNIANVKYILSRDQYGKIMPIENKNWLGRITFARGVKVIEDNQISDILRDDTVDLLNYVLVSEKPKEPFVSNISDTGHADITVNWKKYTPNYRSAEVTVPCNGFIRLSEVYYPGWKILIDGKNVNYYRANLAWITFAIPSGKHIVEMIPGSPYFGKALFVTSVLFLILLGYWITIFVLKRKSEVSDE